MHFPLPSEAREQPIPEDGKIEQIIPPSKDHPHGVWKVTFPTPSPDQEQLLSLPGVVEEIIDGRSYCTKVFTDTNIYTDYNLFRREQLMSDDKRRINLGTTGYSSLSKQFLEKYGIPEGAYAAVIERVLFAIREKLANRGVNMLLLDGFSEGDVDRAIRTTARVTDTPEVGFCCPKFMLYAKDGGTVFVAPSQRAYSSAFSHSSELLLVTGGRGQAFDHDLKNFFSVLNEGAAIPLNVMGLIADADTLVPGFVATDTMDEEGKPVLRVENAAAAIEQRRGERPSTYDSEEALIAHAWSRVRNAVLSLGIELDEGPEVMRKELGLEAK
jgi:hypothetical protein